MNVFKAVMCVLNDTTLLMNNMNKTSKYGLLTMWLCWLGSDWCISRQLWWGHQVPAYQVELPTSTDKQEVGSMDICFYYFCIFVFSIIMFYFSCLLKTNAILNR